MPLSVASAAAELAVAMPTTKVGNPAVFAASTAAIAPGLASVVPASGQVGAPSVASRMNLGLASVSDCMYPVAPFAAFRVGVPL